MPFPPSAQTKSTNLLNGISRKRLPVTAKIAAARAGAAGVDLLLSDSTNAEIPGFVTPEREIGPVLDSIFDKATGASVLGPAAGNVPWAGFGGICQTDND